MTRVKVQAFETLGADGEVWVRNTTHSHGGMYSSGIGGTIGTISGGSSSISLGSVVFSNSNNVSFGLSGSIITASAAAQIGLSGLSAGTTLASSGTVVFSNSNGVSFGVNGQTVTASHNGLTSQSGQAFSASGGSSAFQTLSFANSNGLTFSNSNGSVIASYTVPSTAGLLSAVNVSAGTTSNNLSALTLSNSNNVSFGLNGSVITASATVATSLSNIRVSAGTTSNLLSALTFSNSNNVSFGLNGSVITASASGAGGAGMSVSAGTSSANLASLVFSNSNGVSFGLNGSTITGSHNAIQSLEVNGSLLGSATVGFYNSHNVTFSTSGASRVFASAALLLSAGTSSVGLSSLVFSNSNGVSFGLNGSTITASVNTGGAGVMSVYALGATNTDNKLSFVNSNGITFGLGGIGNEDLTASHNGLTSQSNQAASASNGSFTFQTLAFSNANNVTFGTSAGSIVTASVAAPGGGAAVSVSQWPFAPWPMATSSVEVGTTGGTGGSTQITGSLYIAPMIFPAAVVFNCVQLAISAASAAGTGSATKGHMLGIYTRNGNSLSLSTSYMWAAVVSQNSVTAQTMQWWYGTNSTVNSSSIGGNISASLARLANVIMIDKVTQTLTAGHYYIAVAHTRRSSSVDVWPMGSQGRYSVSQHTAAPEFGSNITSSPYDPYFHGIASTTTNVAATSAAFMPASINLSAITKTGGTSLNQWPTPIFALR